MASKYRLLHIVYLLLFVFATSNALAQPTLPDIAGAADKGIVILSWNCQYDGVKAIAVLRSIDSVFNYTPIGKVKKTDKGVQAFVDGHPVAGKSYYKLVVQFKSGLTWTSNHCSVEVEQTAPTHLPPNDSIQRFIVTADPDKARKVNPVAVPATPKPVVKDNLSVEPEDAEDEPKQQTKTPPNPDDDEDTASSSGKAAAAKRKVYISFDMDPASSVATKTSPKPVASAVPHKIVTVSFDDPTETAPTFIRSLYVYTDPVTGHVDMNLPDDVATHHYSIKFYNDKNEMIIEVPKINATKIILDKRNFQRSGTYKFVLRKDILELEQGYIVIP